MIDWIHLGIVLSIIVVYGAYLLLTGPLRRRFHTPDQIWAEPVTMREILFFSAGIWVLLVAEASPLHDLSENYLFSAHMVQHLLMIIVAPPLLLLGTPGWMVRPLLQNRYVFKAMRFLTGWLMALVIINLSLALWHIPTFYNLALQGHIWHAVEHVMFFGGAMLLWWPLFSPVKELPRLPYPLQILYLFVQSFVPAVIAAFLVFADHAIYSHYVEAPRIFDITAAADQQLGGLIMKVAGTIVLWFAATIIFFVWYRQEEAEIEKSWE